MHASMQRSPLLAVWHRHENSHWPCALCTFAELNGVEQMKEKKKKTESRTCYKKHNPIIDFCCDSSNFVSTCHFLSITAMLFCSYSQCHSAATISIQKLYNRRKDLLRGSNAIKYPKYNFSLSMRWSQNICFHFFLPLDQEYHTSQPHSDAWNSEKCFKCFNVFHYWMQPTSKGFFYWILAIL